MLRHQSGSACEYVEGTCRKSCNPDEAEHLKSSEGFSMCCDGPGLKCCLPDPFWDITPPPLTA